MSLSTAAAIAQLRGLTAKFDTAIETSMPFYPTIARTVRSTGRDEQYGFIGDVPGVREWLGDRIFHTLRAGQFTLANKKWENSVRVEKDDIDDDRIGMYDMVMEQLGVEAAYHPDELMFTLIDNGESAACWDGQFFFDTDHSYGDSGTQSNDLSASATTPSDPSETEFRTAYHAARAAMLGFKRDNGKYFIRPTVKPFRQLLLLVPTNMEEAANQAINKTFVSSGETNIVLDKPIIVASSSLSNNDRFDLYEVGRPLKPYVFQARQPLRRQMKGMDDREFKDVKFMTDARYNCGYLAWWYAVRTTFS